MKNSLRQDGSRLLNALLNFWRARTLRMQIVAVLIVINVLAVGLSFGVLMRMAQSSARSEIAASMELAELYVKEAIANVKPDVPWRTLAANLPLTLHAPRNVRIMVADAAGVSLAVTTPQFEATQSDRFPLAPQWFSSLFDPGGELHSVRIILDGRRITTVVIASTPELLIADVWKQVKTLTLAALLINLLIVISVYLALGRILKPISRLGAGLQDLKCGRFGVRLPQPEVRELGVLVTGFNALAESLESARAENSRLTRHLLTVQDDERRQIAMELHDEAGPCLFGIKASASSLARLGKALPPSDQNKLKDGVASIIEIVGRLQSMNRHLLRNLRPIALGRVSLRELLADLVSRFEREHEEIQFSFRVKDIRRSYGEKTDLAVYRSIQEGLANAVRHSGASAVAVEVGEKNERLWLTVQDNGVGMPPSEVNFGLGLTGVFERVGALSGECAIDNAAQRGAVLSVAIPAPDHAIKNDPNDDFACLVTA